MTDHVREWHLQEFHKNEEETTHDPMEEEYLFYLAVQSGDLQYVREINEKKKFDKMEGKGMLSRNPLTNVKYHFVVTTAMITRSCVMAGLIQEQAYRLSDFYINKMDELKSIPEICELHRQMVLDFTQRMLDFQNSQKLSIGVSKAMEYIYSNIQKRITLEEIAEQVQLSPSHLSRVFSKEMGMSVSDYIRRQKIERAKNLLRFSDFSYIDISNYFGFASQSHFIKTFEAYEGMTPKKYRDMFYCSNWETTEKIFTHKKDA